MPSAGRWLLLLSALLGALLTGGAATAQEAWSVGNDGHAAVVLSDGRLLLSGGERSFGEIVAVAQVYSPASSSSSLTEDMTSPRADHTATLLPDGRVLIVGGDDGAEVLSSLELFDPTDYSFSLLSATLAVPREGHIATSLPDGRVLIDGGWNDDGELKTAEIFDPFTGTATAAEGLEALTFPTVATDKPDYVPGELVTVTGSGWQPGETVDLLFDETPLQHAPHVLTTVADSNGDLLDTAYLIQEYHVGTRFTLHATGRSSSWSAQTGFTDGSVMAVTGMSIISPSGATGAPYVVSTGQHFLVRVTLANNSTIGPQKPDFTNVSVTLSVPSGWSVQNTTLYPYPSPAFTIASGASTTKDYEVLANGTTPLPTGTIHVAVTSTPSYGSCGVGAVVCNDSGDMTISSVPHATLTLGTVSASASLRKAGQTVTVSLPVSNCSGCATAQAVTPTLARILTGTANASCGSGGSDSTPVPADQAHFSRLQRMAIDGEGNVFVADLDHYCIRKLSTDGVVSTVAGIFGSAGLSGDGGPATGAQLGTVTGVALDTMGNLYIASPGTHRVRKVDSNGIITTVAGSWVDPSHNGSYGGDGGPATEALLNGPQDIAVDGQGQIYIADSGNHCIRRVGADGTIHTVLSGHDLATPSGLELDPQGTLYIADRDAGLILALDPDGRVRRIAGGGTTYLDGVAGTQTRLYEPTDVALDRGGNVYIAETTAERIRKVSIHGVISTLAGGSSQDLLPLGDGGAPARALFYYPMGVGIGPRGDVWISDSYHYRLRRIASPFITLDGNLAIPSKDGDEIYLFDQDYRHLETRDAVTGATRFQFSYNSPLRLLTDITDGDGNHVHIARDDLGTPLAIVAPFGQTTTLGLGSNGYLESLSGPGGYSVGLLHNTGGLLYQMTDTRGGEHHFYYDDTGRLTDDYDATTGHLHLERTIDQESDIFHVDVTTAVGRVSTHSVDNSQKGIQIRQNTAPSGAWSRTTHSSGSLTQEQSNGMVSTVKMSPDPRFGMQAPLADVTVRTPGGTTLQAVASRTVSLSDPNDILSLETQTDTLTINGADTLTSAFDVATRTATVTTPELRQYQSVVDAQGRPTEIDIPGLLPATATYTLGRLETISQGDRLTTFTYDPNTGYLTSVEAVNGGGTQTVSFDYDEATRTLVQTLPDGREATTVFDESGNVSSVTPPGTPAHNHAFEYTLEDEPLNYDAPLAQGVTDRRTHYDYNDDHQLMLVTLPDQSTIEPAYDPTTGRISSLTWPEGVLTYSYDDLPPPNGTESHQLKTLALEGDKGDETLTFAHDGALLTGTTWSGALSGQVSITYDDHFRLHTAEVSGGASITYDYDQDGVLAQAGDLLATPDSLNGMLVSTSLGDLTTSQGYLAPGQTAGYGELLDFSAVFDSTTLFSTHFERDDLGRITSKTEGVIDGSGVLQTDVYEYTYDDAGRLWQVYLNSAKISEYGYDDNSNRTSRWSAGVGTVGGEADAQDRLLTYGNNTYTYTLNGFLESRTDDSTPSTPLTTQYTYDRLGNLLEVDLPGCSVEYVVDGLGRRVRRISTCATTTPVQGFLYLDGLRSVAELDGNGEVVSTFVYGTHGNVPDYFIRGGERYRIIADHLGSPRLVVKVSDGTIVQRMDYDELGNVLSDTNPGFQPFGFAGGLYDPDTHLTRFGARDYDAETGRWTAKDPILFAGGDTNLYGYVFSDPINLIDPWGLYGYSYPYSADIKELLFQVVTVGPYDAALGWKAKSTASQRARSSHLPGSQDGPQDAYRHCLWSCLMTRSMGPDEAKDVGETHESCSQNQSPQSEAMDRYNNGVGRALGSTKGTCENLCQNGGTRHLHDYTP